MEAEDVVCGVLTPTVPGWRYQNCLSSGGKWFCLLQYNATEYAALAQMAQHTPLEDLEQFCVKPTLGDAMRHFEC